MDDDATRLRPATGAAPPDDDATRVRPPPPPERTVPERTVPEDPDATRRRHARTVLRKPAGRDPTLLLHAGIVATPLPAPRGLPLALAPGFQLHEYRIEAVLGQGGFGITYLATDVHLNAQVAIKEYLPEEIAFRAGDRSVSPNASQHRDRYRQGLESFLTEARTLASLRHPAIVRVARFFEAHQTAYLVMEYEHGQSLRGWWPEHRKLGEAGLVERLLPLLDGLAVVHAGGFLHRDIKPENIQVRAADGRLVLLDFGSAGQTLAVAGQGAVVVTPGYAPLEQYGFGRQGAWTDIYALGATLYWAVTGRKPPDAEMRAANPRSYVPAVEAAVESGYGLPFLQAIDRALLVDATQRPQTVAEWRLALCADHIASLDLQEALRDGDTVIEGDAQQPLAQRVRARTGRFFGTLLHPPAWPLALKMALVLLATALLPMGLTAAWNLRAAQAAVTEGELRFVQQIAVSSAGRISQFITDNRHFVRTLASDVDFAEALARQDSAVLGDKLARLVESNPDVQRIVLASAAGRVLASSVADGSGAEVAAERWFTEALRGQTYTGSLAQGPQEPLPGLVLAQPVRAADGTPAGVLAVRLRGSSLAAIVDEVRNDATLLPFLVDRAGTVLHHIDADLLFSPLDEPGLAPALTGAQAAGSVGYRSRANAREEIAGFAPVTAHEWVVAVAKSRTDFEAPLKPLQEQLGWSVALAGLLFAGLALRFARSIVRPIRALTQAAQALKEGHYDTAAVEVKRRDELGQLGRTFNVMVDVLRQRERERRRDAPGDRDP